ncbi:MAG: hypothetical protein K9L66_02170 [Spirochaetaceae bacterium]|nr:hypothetical protein [Spirochaetaceae bacterium]MCF7948810.1 hypothetical protein [Spirochaetia bacterium]MCF7950459.1 hypothetical protein [Spirochaetaceae bacterium]
MKTRTISITMILLLMFAGAGLAFSETSVVGKALSSDMSDFGAYGGWRIRNNRLYQQDTQEHLAKINFPAPQRGLMEYNFDVRYEAGGLSDRMGGFGIQLFVDDAHKGKSWGNGKSYLLWLNYDENPTYGKPGFRGQVYRSYSDTHMELLEGYDVALNPAVLTAENMQLKVPVKIQVNGNTGLVKVWDPSRPGTYVRFYLDEAPKSGKYISLRTNSLAVSFGNPEVTRK